jgi:glyoxylase-like metal-dependent hydrolase (beta-lactamase superfamily II)
MTSPYSIQKYQSASGGQVYQIPVEAIPGMWAFAYYVVIGDYRVLIDTGSGFGNSNADLDNGLKTANRDLGFSEKAFSHLTHVFITHGHIDHFGGLNHLKKHSDARIGVHELDVRNLTCYEERLVVVEHNLNVFLIEAGVNDEHRQAIMSLHRFTKGMYHSLAVDFTYNEIGMSLGPFQFFHVPGHCAGHVVIRLEDILFSGDHILSGISPHQAPESLTLWTGLGHYLQSLGSVDQWAGGVSITLAGHHGPIYDLSKRVKEIEHIHAERLTAVREFLTIDHSIQELADHLFGAVEGYNILLAIEEAGAHVEYLYQRGELNIDNLADYEAIDRPFPLRYRRAA